MSPNSTLFTSFTLLTTETEKCYKNNNINRKTPSNQKVDGVLLYSYCFLLNLLTHIKITIAVAISNSAKITDGITWPLSYFEIDCLETFSFSANCSCVRSFAFRAVSNHFYDDEPTQQDTPLFLPHIFSHR